MIQLPSKIRTTFFNAFVEVDPYELFSHEEDRVAAIIYAAYSLVTVPAFGRSSQDAMNSDAMTCISYMPITIYGPEPIWVCLTRRLNSPTGGMIIVQGIYRV